MPQFTSSPALQARTFDIQDIQRRSLQNQVLQSNLQQAQGEAQRQNQLRAVMPGVGAEAGLGPSAQQALAIDPSQLNALMKIPKAERDRAKERAGTLADMGMVILNSPGVQRPALDAQLRQMAEEYDIPPESIPPLGSPDYEPFLKMNIAKAGQIKTLLDQVPDAPSGYQRTEGGLTFTPGGPADPAQAGKLATAKREPGGEDPFGKGMEGQAYNALLEYKSYVDAGQTPPSELVNRARVAQHTLSKRRFFRDPEGNLLSYTPGIPEGFPTPDKQSGKASEPDQEGALTGGLRTEIEAKPEVDVSIPVSTIRKISKLLNEGGETITGVVGTAKRLGGGLARQAGIPISPKAERLQRLLETLQGQMGPIILNEKRLSETERERLERIVGDVSPTMDEQALRGALADLVDFIENVGKR